MPEVIVQEDVALKTPPRRWQRREKAAAQLTTAAAMSLLTAGRLTRRDLDILRAVWLYGVMSTGQIRRLVFNPLTARSAAVVASRRLNYLYQAHCLNRAFRGIGQEFVYTLDVLGMRLIRVEQRQRLGEKIDLFKNISEKLLRLEHSLTVTEFGVSLTEAARLHPAGGGLRWWGDDVLMLTKPDDGHFNPDGMGVLRLGNNKTAFFLEWDHGDDDSLFLPTVGDKIAGYVGYLCRPDAWRSQFTRFPAVLMVTHHVEEALIKAVEPLRLLSSNQDLTVLVTAPEMLTKQGVLSCVWWKAGAGRAEMSLKQLVGEPTQ